jgi:polar amino acid transport system permease protein
MPSVASPRAPDRIPAAFAGIELDEAVEPDAFLVNPVVPFAGIDLPAFAAVTLTLLLNPSSFCGEIFRAGNRERGGGADAATRSTGLTRLQAMRPVVVPQVVSNVVPDLISNTLEVVKLTSIASVVALPELLYAADMVRSITCTPRRSCSPPPWTWRSSGPWSGC